MYKKRDGIDGLKVCFVCAEKLVKSLKPKEEGENEKLKEEILIRERERRVFRALFTQQRKREKKEMVGYCGEEAKRAKKILSLKSFFLFSLCLCEMAV